VSGPYLREDARHDQYSNPHHRRRLRLEFGTGTVTLPILQAEAFGQRFDRNPNPIALHVDDVHQARAQLESQGIEFLGETIDSGVCHMAIFQDPDGHALMLHHRYAPPEARPPGIE
jgi:predicted enzyme related to lactoylglutathione lyase